MTKQITATTLTNVPWPGTAILLDFAKSAGPSILRLACLMALVAGPGLSARGGETSSLVISEVLFDTAQPNDNNWEWIEVYNGGDTDIDLDGYFIDDDTGLIPATGSPNILHVDSGGNAANTVVPAGGAAVIYNGFRLEYNDDRFRSAWQLDASTRVIGADFFPGLRNAGDVIGLWASIDDYAMESRVVDKKTQEDVGVGSYDFAATHLDFRPKGFFRGNNSASMSWNGQGSVADPANWAEVTTASPGALTSVRTFVTGGKQPVNSTDDVGSPGDVPGGTPAAGLLFTELMYDSTVSGDRPFEWVEVYNNTGQTIDFSVTPYYFDDDDDDAMTEPNVAAGSIPHGTAAVLYEDALTLDVMQTAWGANGNYISVADWSSLSNGGDWIGLWDNATDYNADKKADVIENAVVSLQYDDDGKIWPDSQNTGGSVYLTDLSADPADGTNWELAFAGDGVSRNAEPVFSGQVEDHVGGDVGSPGFFTTDITPMVDLDFDDDDVIGINDIDLLTAQAISVGQGNAPDLAFDLNLDGTVNVEDRDQWLAEAGPANGFAGGYLLGDIDLSGAVNFSDFVSLNNAFARMGQNWIGGDFNLDNVTNFTDFVILNNNFAMSVPRAAATVPEPSTAGILLLILAGMSIACRRRALP